MTPTAPAVTAEPQGEKGAAVTATSEPEDARDVQYDEPTEPTQPNIDIVDRPRRGRAPIELSDDAIAEVIRMRTLNISLRRIADWLDEKHGVRVAHQTIARWTSEVATKHRHIDPERLANLRAREGMRLTALMDLAMEQATTFRGTKIGLEAIGQGVQVSRAFRGLYGLDLPVRHDISMTVETEQDRALRAMLEQARLKAERDERRVIEAASADPDL